MDVISLDIPDVKIITPKKFGDHRGFFSETYNREAFLAAGLDYTFVQDSHSWSAEAGTVRGLHFQRPPCAQDKLIRVIRGAVFDVAVDLRRSAPSYGRHVSVVLSAAAWNQILIPAGFAHGFCTLEPDTEVLYKMSRVYAPDHEQGLSWNDPVLGIAWPAVAGQAVLSDRDRRQPRLAELEAWF